MSTLTNKIKTLSKLFLSFSNDSDPNDIATHAIIVVVYNVDVIIHNNNIINYLPL